MKRTIIKLQSILIILLVLFMCTTRSTAQLKIDAARFKILLDEHRYADAYDEAIKLRIQPYGKCYQVDYIIGKSLCESNKKSSAQACFNYIDSAYQMNPKIRQFIRNERTSCGNQQQGGNEASKILSLLSYMINNKNDSSNFSYSRGKMAVRWCDNYRKGREHSSSGNHSHDLVSDTTINPDKLSVNLSEQKMEERLFEPTQKQEAQKFYANLLGNEYRVDTTEHYVIVTNTDSRFNSKNILQARNKLDKAFNFYTSYFGLQRPGKLITVYLMYDKKALDDAALKVHNLNLPEANIGYSCLGDLSILGISNPELIGTMYHELFHLIVRADIGDIPAWLDEGIASLYETSSWKNDSILKGDVNNWRTKIIQSYTSDAPHLSLQYLVNNNWKMFELSQVNDVCEVSLAYAYSKHLAIFLQEKRLLKKALQQFRDRTNVFTDTTAVNEPAVNVLEECYGKKIEDIQKDFEEWFAHTYNHSTGKVKATPTQLDELRGLDRSLMMMGESRLNPDDKIKKKNFQETCRKYIAELEKRRELFAPNAMAPPPSEEKIRTDLTQNITDFIKDCNKFVSRYVTGN